MEDYILINRIERLDHLHSLIRQDVKELGIKLPKLKRLKKLNQTRTRSCSQDDVFSSRLFGEPLYQIHGTFISDYGCVPQFLIDAAMVVDKHIETEGIFRKSGSIARQKELQLTIDEGKSIEVANIYDMTALIKQFFRDLPEPIFVPVYHESFIKCYNLSPDKDPKRALLEMCLLLPMENIGALRFLLHLLSRIGSKSERNKMTPNNLAVVMAPNLMHLNKGTEKMSSGEEKLLHIHTCIIELLIKNWELVGMVSPTIRQQLNMMSECFATDDDLGASDDNTLEDSKDVLRRKKRKRSGSLTGFVSSIAHGIAKLRRSTDGKSISMTSNSYISSDDLFMDTSDFTNQTVNVPESVTPCVMRKKQTSIQGVPFSASKRQAILSNLPQKSALASTPFTPASTVKRGNHPYHNSAAKTAIMNATTPGLNTKTSRKKLNLFNTPGSNKKIKRPTSTSAILESAPSVDKSGKGKNFFRRLSGSRAVKENTSRDTSTFSSTSEQAEDGFTDSILPSGESTHLDATTQDLQCSVTLQSLSSSSLQDSELSIVVVDDQAPLSSSFENDARALLSAIKRQNYGADSLYERESLDGEVVASHETRSPCRSKSLHNPSFRKDFAAGGNLSPGQRNTTRQPSKVDECMTNTCVVAKTGERKMSAEMRRSRKDEFEDGKLGQKYEGHRHKQDSDVDLHEVNHNSSSESKHLEDGLRSDMVNIPAQLNTSLFDAILAPPLGFGDQTVLEDQLDAKQITDQNEGDQEIGLGYDVESVSGFSTTSGGTVMRRTESGNYLQHGISSTSGSSLASFMSYDSVLNPSTKSKPLQSATSSDSLFSVESRLSERSTGSEPKLSRCTSSDSGKGSLMEDIAEDLCLDRPGKYNNECMGTSSNGRATNISDSDCVTLRHKKQSVSEGSSNLRKDSKLLSGVSLSSSSSSCLWESGRDCTMSEENKHSVSLDTTRDLEDMTDKTDIHRKRSISAEHLMIPALSRSSIRMRSHSIHVSPGKKFNYKPHLEITRETHKILARAGYFKPADDNSNSRYVQVEVKSPKRSSHREEMMISLRSSFRERPSQMNRSVRSASYTDTRTAAQDKSTFESSDEYEKLSANKRSNEKRENNNDVELECLDMDHKPADRRDNIDRNRGTKSSLSQAKISEKLFTEADVMENHHSVPKDEPVLEENDTNDKKPAQNPTTLERPKDTNKMLARSASLDNEMTSQVKIKRANVVLQRHDSIMNIQQAGLVTQSVRHFTEPKPSGQFCNFAMPLVTKRGTSPVRIPTIFAKRDNRPNHYKNIPEEMGERIGSRESIELPAASNTQDISQEEKFNSCDDPASSAYNKPHNEIKYTDCKSLTNDDTQNICPLITSMEEASLKLSESLVETITDVCTPLAVKFQNKKLDRDLTKSPLMESTNTAHAARGSVERMRLCASKDLNNKDTGVTSHRNTPIRANWHNIKRLQNRNSPRKCVPSPKSKPSSQCDDVTASSSSFHLLTSVDIHIDDEKQ